MNRLSRLLVTLVLLTSSINTNATSGLPFNIDVPDNWVPSVSSPATNSWSFVSEDNSQQLTVEIHPFVELPSHPQKHQYLIEFVAERQAVETKHKGVLVVHNSINEKEYPTGYGYSYDLIGDDGWKASNKVICNGYGIGVFFLETFDLTSSEFEDQKARLLNSVGMLDVE